MDERDALRAANQRQRELEAEKDKAIARLHNETVDLAADLASAREQIAKNTDTYFEMVQALAERDEALARLMDANGSLAAENDALTAENERLERRFREAETEWVERYERLEAALKGVLAEADRKTDAFDRAHAALNQTPFTQDEVDAAVEALDTLAWQT